MLTHPFPASRQWRCVERFLCDGNRRSNSGINRIIIPERKLEIFSIFQRKKTRRPSINSMAWKESHPQILLLVKSSHRWIIATAFGLKVFQLIAIWAEYEKVINFYSRIFLEFSSPWNRVIDPNRKRKAACCCIFNPLKKKSWVLLLSTTINLSRNKINEKKAK